MSQLLPNFLESIWIYFCTAFILNFREKLDMKLFSVKRNSMINQKQKNNFVFITLSLGLVGCGGGESGNTNTSLSLPTTTTPDLNLLTGNVVKGPLNNALVFADYNSNGIYEFILHLCYC